MKVSNIPTSITSGVKISVEHFYQPEHSDPVENKYIFAYRVTIENTSDYTVQLMRRHWFIVESNGLSKEVEGEGVIGQQPIIHPGASHQYVSWTNMATDIGKMSGYYTMVRSLDSEAFHVTIPEFKLIAPQKMN